MFTTCTYFLDRSTWTIHVYLDIDTNGHAIESKTSYRSVCVSKAFSHVNLICHSNHQSNR